METSNEDKEVDTEIQETRTLLRERFLKFIAKISNGSECEINMFENITVKANIRASDLEFENIAVDNLQTPSLPVNKAILRSRDIISINLYNVSKDLLNN